MTLPGFLDRIHLLLFLTFAVTNILMVLVMPFYAGSCPYGNSMNRGEGSVSCFVQRASVLTLSPAFIAVHAAILLVPPVDTFVNASVVAYSEFLGLALLLAFILVALWLWFFQLWFLSLVFSSMISVIRVLTGYGSNA